MSWENAKDHIHNWQNPNNIGLTFHYVAKYSRLPFRSKELFKYIRKGQQILEYGCALAPMYRTYREYLNHFKCSWVLADIPNFPFHYARYTYAKDAGVIFSTITDEIMDDPLRGIDKKFDLIIIQEVFEHLHSPLHVAKYLNERLRIGGLLFFDYVLSDAKGLDTEKLMVIGALATQGIRRTAMQPKGHISGRMREKKSTHLEIVVIEAK